MNIFYVNVIEQNAGWGAEWFIDRAFRTLNHSSYCVDYRQHRYQLTCFFWNAPRSDVFFLQRGDNFPIPLIQAVQVPRFFWASELVSRCRDQDRLLRSHLFDHTFMHSQACIDTVVSNGWVDRKDCSILLNGFDDSIFKPAAGVNKDVDILFVGNLTPRRRKIFDRLEKYHPIHRASAFGKEFVQLMNRSKIVLNIHAEDYLDTETRVFEALGTCSLLVSEQLSSDNPFTNEEIVQADSIDDISGKLEYYLHHPDERERIAQNGYRTALRGHTYLHRAREIIDVMSGYLKGPGYQPSGPLRKDWRTITYGIEESAIRSMLPIARLARKFVHR